LKKYFNLILSVLFGLNLIVYISFFNGVNLIPDKAIFPFLIFSTVIGFLLSWCGNKGNLRIVGIVGNSLVLFISAIAPILVRIFIWNQP